jgi:uncharacterized protein
VIMLDFTFGSEQIAEIRRRAVSLLVLDHHETAIANCAPLPQNGRWSQGDPIEVVLDMEHSGAMLAWLRLHQSLFVDETTFWRWYDVVCGVERRDLWKMQPGDAEQHAALASVPKTLDEWGAAIQRGREALIEEGRAILRYQERLIEACVATARFEMVGDVVVPVAAAPYMIGSDVAGWLAEEHPEYPFAAYYVDGSERRAYGLRVRGGGDFNVAAYAARFGGGGHPKAAGFSAKLPCPF